VRTWPGLVGRGLKARVYAKVIPDATSATQFVLIAERRVADSIQALDPTRVFTRPIFTQTVAADAAQVPIWITGEVELPDDIYEAGRPLPSVRLGIRPAYDIGETYDRWVSTCGIQTVSVWGVF